MTIMQIPITKASVAAKGDRPAKVVTLDVDTSAIPEDMYALAMYEGLKVLLNARMSPKLVGAVTKLTGKDLEAAQAAAMKIATENLSNLMKGEIKAKKSKTAKALDADGQPIAKEVMTEALRQAREVVRNEIRKAGQKISQYKASQITEYATQVVAADPSYIAKARDAIAAREQIVAAIDVSAFKPDAELAAKAKAKAAEKAAEKAIYSKTQAGIPTRRKAKAPVTVAPTAIPTQHVHPSHGTVN